MEIVIEESIAINLFLNFLILKVTARVVGKKERLVLLSSLIGSLFALFAPIWKLTAVIKLCLIICVALIMTLISFKYKSFKSYLVNLAVFLMATFLFGGGCLAMQQTFGSYPIFVVAIISAVIYIALLIVFKIVSHYKRIKKFTYKLTFKDGDKIVNEEGYLDSGNVLYDTITKKPIVLVSFDVFHKFYENISYISLLTKDFNSSSIKNGHYIKINSVGRGTSILIFTVDELQVEGNERKYKNVALGLSFSGFEKSFGKNVLLHCDYS